MITITITIGSRACLRALFWNAVTTNGRHRFPVPLRKSGVARNTALAPPVHRRCHGGCRTHSKAAAAYAGDASCDRIAKCLRVPSA